MLFLFTSIIADQGQRALEPKPAGTGVRMGHQSVFTEKKLERPRYESPVLTC